MSLRECAEFPVQDRRANPRDQGASPRGDSRPISGFGLDDARDATEPLDNVDRQSVATTSGGEPRGREIAGDVDGPQRHLLDAHMDLLLPAMLATAASIVGLGSIRPAGTAGWRSAPGARPHPAHLNPHRKTEMASLARP